jgi:hypothetical protein
MSPSTCTPDDDHMEILCGHKGQLIVQLHLAHRCRHAVGGHRKCTTHRRCELPSCIATQLTGSTSQLADLRHQQLHQHRVGAQSGAPRVLTGSCSRPRKLEVAVSHLQLVTAAQLLAERQPDSQHHGQLFTHLKQTLATVLRSHSSSVLQCLSRQQQRAVLACCLVVPAISCPHCWLQQGSVLFDRSIPHSWDCSDVLSRVTDSC